MYKFTKSDIPLYIQLYEQIKQKIKDGKRKSGEKLPSIRTLANEYNLSKNTVQNAYNQLFAEGYIDSIAQKGYYVNEDLYQDIVVKNEKKNTKDKIYTKYKYDFYPAQLSSDTFPIKTWNKLFNKVLKENINYGSYVNPQGLKSLRIELKKYLSSFRGVNCSEDQIVLCSGFSDAMFIISILFKELTSNVAIEADIYRVAKKVFEQMSYEIEYLSMTEQGINIKELERIKAKLIYLTPAHQYITGVTIPITNRIKILEWAQKTDSYIIEDDYDSELSYYNKPIPALQGINNNDRVIYYGTVSKSFSPALRISYLILPNSLLDKYKSSFDYPFSGIPLDIQKTLELFIKEEYFIKHIRKIRTLNRKKHNIMKEYLEENLKDDIEILREGSGLNMLIRPKIDIDLKLLEEKCLENSIKIYNRKDDLYVMGFGGFKENEVKDAIEAFVKVWNLVKN